MNKLLLWLVLTLAVCLTGYVIVSLILVILPVLAMAFGIGVVLALLICLANLRWFKKKDLH